MLNKFFKKTLKRNVYAVEGGFMLGSVITVIDYDEANKNYAVLSCKLDADYPTALEIPEKDIKEGIEKGVLKYIETLKRPLYRDCKKEYNLLKNTK